MISADVKANKKQKRIKRSGGYNRDVKFFSTRACGSGHQVSLATKQPRLSLHRTIMKKPFWLVLYRF